MIYGYINEHGCLTSREVTEEEAKKLDKIWKPVADIQESELQSDDEDYFIKLQPYDAGDKIKFRYVKTFDTTRLRNQIKTLEAELASTDYQVIKCYEASLLGEAMPYDVVTLTSARQLKRDKINELQIRIENA